MSCRPMIPSFAPGTIVAMSKACGPFYRPTCCAVGRLSLWAIMQKELGASTGAVQSLSITKDWT